MDVISTREDATSYVSRFYRMMLQEIEEANYTRSERGLMESDYYYGRYVNILTRPYFEETVVPVIGRALLWLNDPQCKCILDLGCGVAMQSLIFAALGKRVLAVDIRAESIAAGKKRKRYYEDLLGRELDIEFLLGDFRELDLQPYSGQVDGVFSMSAFSYVEPLEKTVALIDGLCSSDARIFLFEENASNIFARILRHQSLPMPPVIADEFKGRGFAMHALDGTCALPKQFWFYPRANGCVRGIDGALRQSMLLAFSYALEMERRAEA